MKQYFIQYHNTEIMGNYPNTNLKNIDSVKFDTKSKTILNSLLEIEKSC